MTIGVDFVEEPRTFEHVSVMTAEVLSALAPERGGLYLDLTAGGGGHSAAILRASNTARVVAFDRDPVAVAAAQSTLAEFGERALVVRGTFRDVEAWLEHAHVSEVAGLIADLGVSSEQLTSAERGMSFRSAGPLDMRMDPESGETALSLIARLSQDELANVIYNYGEERRSRRVARCIKLALADGDLETTVDLRRAVVRAVGPRRVGGVDPATRTFQALRIAVNDELGQLEALLEMAPRILAPGGVVAILSFHSLEDRLVKRALRDREVWENLSKKPLVPGPEEQAHNPRSRSAKLRAARRLAPEGSEG